MQPMQPMAMPPMMPGQGLQDPYAVPRRALDMEDYLDVLRRHRAWIVGPLFAGLVLSTVVAFLWPDTYVSTSVIRVIPPQVPQEYVRTNIQAEMSSRINSMAGTILSRTNLNNIVNTHGLYPRDRKRLPMEDVIENMRKDIRISPVGVMASTGSQNERINAFRISYAYENRMLAQKVCADLTTRFINENLTQRSNQSVQTSDFLKDQLEDRRKRLDEIDKQLTAFRMKNAGRLPEELQTTIAALTMAEQRVANVNSQIYRAQQDKMILEGRLSSLRDQLRYASQPIPIESQTAQVKSERLMAMDREIMTMETRLAALKEMYKDAHPDVDRVKGEISVLRRQRDLFAKEEESTKRPEAPRQSLALTMGQQRDIRAIEAEMAQTQTLIEAKKTEVSMLQRELTTAMGSAGGLQSRVQSVPLGEAKYDELLRERQLAKDQYEEMSRKSEQSRVATELENRKQSEQLELLDPASLPQTPTDPNRWMILGAGSAGGLILGLFIAAGREMKDTTLKNLKDVRAYTQLVVLGSVPLLENDLVVRRRRRLTWLAWSTACLAGIVIMVVSVVFYYATKA